MKLVLSLTIFCLLLLEARAHSNNNCSQNVTNLTIQKLGGRNYYFSTSDQVKSNWTAALEYCQSQDMNLVSVETRRENDLLTTQARNSTPSRPSLGGWLHFWLGATDAATEGRFLWSSDEAQLVFTAWYPHEGEPNDEGGDEDCVSMVPNYDEGVNNWVDSKCDKEHYFICEQRDC